MVLTILKQLTKYTMYVCLTNEFSIRKHYETRKLDFLKYEV